MPSGSYAVIQGAVSATDAGSGAWMYRFAGAKTEMGVVVPPSGSLTYDCKAKMQVTPSVTRAGAAEQFSLILRDYLGNRISGLTNQAGKAPPPPEIRIVDSSGREAFRKSFEYG